MDRFDKFTDRARKVLTLAQDEAQRFNHNYIGTEHLLLGLMKEGQSIAAKILESLGARLDEVRQETLALLGDQYYPRPKKRSQTPVLDEFARDLTQLARESKLDPVIGREQEIERVIQILARRTKNNPVLIGEPGVGKTAIVEGLAQKIINHDVPDVLVNKRLLQLDLGALVAGTKYRGQFEERLKGILKELRENKDILVFVDEIHSLIGAGSAGKQRGTQECDGFLAHGSLLLFVANIRGAIVFRASSWRTPPLATTTPGAG